MLREDAKRLVEPEPQEKIGRQVLQKDDWRAQPLEHLHLGIDQKLGVAFDLAPRDRYAAPQDRAQRAFLREKHLQGAESTLLGERSEEHTSELQSQSNLVRRP